MQALRRLRNGHWHLLKRSVPRQLTHQSDATSNHPHPALLHGRLVVPVSVVNWIEVRAEGGRKSENS